MRGFTLIEMIIAIAVMMVLLFMGVPLTMQWIGSSNLQSAKTLFNKGMAMTRSRALRNVAGAQQNEPAAFLLLSGGNVLCAQEATYSVAVTATNVPRTPANTFSCTGAAWTGTLPNGTTGTLNSAANQCVALTSAGVPVSVTLSGMPGGGACVTTTSYSMTSMGVTSSATTIN
ncbi:prepilin-type N-terminal cleavage/methylation domain-containing protein [Silvimonas terrae]|uniref:Prepilin-type N-terminal cleavage/methylation domain-containing protein n=1 Tax=Silvimonas terrae TaxID=300266 RepID=A0A840RM12_9NEIS|nr:prepilin-type N-terminal cleavage/methylation domain-containing protein [Silvimonas terrae]MBB5193540.1 prepilin-type N-terminal cleavage/methylation domain-containing protein [Silvimonas terrae]